MSLDPSLREANVRDSVKKFFVDNLYRTKRVSGLTFDRGLATPKIQGVNSVDKWVAIQFGDFELRGSTARIALDVYCCTRSDAEGFKLAQVRDTVVEYLVDEDQPDKIRRITLYRSHPTEAWTNIGAMVVSIEPESKQLDGPDDTKFKIIPVVLTWGVKMS